MPTATTPRPLGTRSRIDGRLERFFPAQLKIRLLDPEDPAADPEMAGGEGEGDDDKPAAQLLRLELSASSEEPYLRSSFWDEDWIEVLGHKPDEVDLTRLNGGAPLLANHDRWSRIGDTPLAGIGVIEKAWLDGARLMAIVAISRRGALEDLRQDIADGLVRNVSIGYIINERILVKSAEGAPDEYRVTKWVPFEISLADVPADATVGLGRSANPLNPDKGDPAQPQYRVIQLSPTAGATTGARTMTTPENAPAATSTAPTDGFKAERERMREIQATAAHFRQLDGIEDLANTAIDNGTTAETFRAQVTRKLQDTGQFRAAESPEIGMSPREVRSYSLCRALLAASDPINAHTLAPFELECSRAAQDQRGDSRPGKDRDSAITIPVDVLSRGIELSDKDAWRAAQALISRARMGGAAQNYRDLGTGTPTAGGNLVATQLLGSSFIELLRNALVLDRMGITTLTDLNGNIAIPSQTGAATTYWVTEGNPPAESQQTIGQVSFTPKTIGAFTDYTRRLLLQSSIGVEAFVRADLAAQVAQGILTAAINGAGSGGEPTGILNTSGIGAVAAGTNGSAPLYDHLVDLETAVSVANADVGTLAYLTNSKARGKLRKTQVFSGTNGQPVWSKGRESGLGDVLGYDAYVTNAVPSNLTKGASTGVCSAGIFGNWADFILALWGGLDVMLDPYAMSTTGSKRIVALQDCDMGPRRTASFAAVKDWITT